MRERCMNLRKFFIHQGSSILSKNFNSATYVLVHGAWHGGWCWERVIPLLENQGHRVIAPDLPGHGKDVTPFSGITLQTYVDRITESVRMYDHPVVLVGHSMAGVVISQVAENIPDKISALIYIAAFIPMDNESLSSQARKARSAGVSSEMSVNEDKNEIDLRKTDRVRELFFNACDAGHASRGMTLLQKEPFLPFIDTINISHERFGSVRKIYVECLKDEAIKQEDQKRMSAQANCEIVTLENADHSPFYSAHEDLAKILIKYGNIMMPQSEYKLGQCTL